MGLWKSVRQTDAVGHTTFVTLSASDKKLSLQLNWMFDDLCEKIFSLLCLFSCLFKLSVIVNDLQHSFHKSLFHQSYKFPKKKKKHQIISIINNIFGKKVSHCCVISYVFSSPELLWLIHYMHDMWDFLSVLWISTCLFKLSIRFKYSPHV